MFYIVTGMAVSAQQNAPIASGSASAAAPAPEGGLEGEVATPKKASLLLGAPGEQVNVHLNIQVLYFTPKDTPEKI